MILNFLFWFSGMVLGGLVVAFLFVGELEHLKKDCKQEEGAIHEDKGGN